MKQYFRNIGITLSILLNVVLGGETDQTFSARSHNWRRYNKSNIATIIDYLFWFDDDHCLTSWVYWVTQKFK